MLYDLFVVGDEANSKKAIRLRTTDCNLCDVRQMQQIPTFLKGVPSLYIRESKLVMTGTQCLNFLQSLQEEEEKKMKFTTKPRSNFVSHAPSRDYSDEKKISETDLQQLIQERENQLPKQDNPTNNTNKN
tara:strand:- start:305 stop:694 length:390 start_codon:yes stop_codon:yes gene_type:complete